MSNIRKSDVKNHLSPKFHTDIHLVPAESLPDATHYSAAEPVAVEASAPGFAKDFFGDHSSSGAAVAPAMPVAGSTSPQPPAVSKNAQV